MPTAVSLSNGFRTRPAVTKCRRQGNGVDLPITPVDVPVP
jgi:hypothetical protein